MFLILSSSQVSSSFATWAEDKLDEIKDGCKMNIFQSSSSLSGNATEFRRQATERLQLILYEVCPKQCSGHGQCDNSMCTCEEGTLTIQRYETYGMYNFGFCMSNNTYKILSKLCTNCNLCKIFASVSFNLCNNTVHCFILNTSCHIFKKDDLWKIAIGKNIHYPILTYFC